MPHLDPKSSPESEPVMLDEYDFSSAVRGNPRQYLAQRKRQGLQPIGNSERAGSDDLVVNIKTVDIKKATVDSNGTLTVKLPDNIDSGEYQITLLIHEPSIS